MFLRKNFSHKTGRTHLAIVQGYRDANGKNRHKTVKTLGYLDELQKQFSDPISHFTEIAKQMNSERLANCVVTINLDLTEQLERGGINRKNYGHLVFSKLYHELEIDRFLNNARRHKNFEFNSEAIMRLLLYSRLLSPSSKRAAHLDRGRFFDSFEFTLYDVYDALTHFNEISEPLQRYIHEKVVHQYGRNTDLVYYDVTNYYFEIDKQDDFRRKGASKEKRKSPIVQMGLLMDTFGLPISYKLFPGNTHDSQTLMPMLANLKKQIAVKRVVTVADKGLNSGDNIAFSASLGDGYIYSKSIRGASEEFKKWVLDERGYHITSKTKIKSKLVPDAEIWVSMEQVGKKTKRKKMKVEQKWIVFYSKKYATRAKHKREEAIAKALKMIASPSKYKSSFDYGVAGYIKNLKIDKSTGEISNIEDTLFLDLQKIEEEEQYDGYYALITSELDNTDEQIIEIYKGLWRIEESFKITKSVFKSRPVFLHSEEHINAHFLICFLALLIGRIAEKRLGGKHTIAEITETLNKISCTHLEQNIWIFDFANDFIDEINVAFETDFGKKAMQLHEIKSNLANTKQSKL